MKNLALKLYFLAFFYHFMLLSIKADIVHEELSSIVESMYESGDLSYYQHEYVQNEISSYPGCKDLYNLFTILEISFYPIWESLENNCSPKKTNTSNEKSLKADKIQIKSAYSEKFQLATESNRNASQIQYQLISQNLSLKASHHNGLDLPTQRILEINWNWAQLELGNPRLEHSIYSVLGKYYLAGAKPQMADWFFPQSAYLNGAVLNFSPFESQLSFYGYWNRISEEEDRRDFSILGAQWTHAKNKFRFMAQSHLQRNESLKKMSPSRWINGVEFDLPVFGNNLNAELSHSNTQQEYFGNWNKQGVYSSLQWKFLNEKSEFKVFQTAGNWENPLAGAPLKWEDNWRDSVPSYESEGGIWTRSKIQLEEGLKWLGFSHGGKWHWSLQNKELYYLRNEFQNELDFNYFQWTNKYINQNYSGALQQSLGFDVRINWPRINPSLQYRYLWGNYQGSYPNYLKFSLKLKPNGSMEFSPEIAVPDLEKVHRRFHFQIRQKYFFAKGNSLNIRGKYYFLKNEADYFQLRADFSNSFAL